MATKDEVVKILAILGAAYPNFRMAAETPAAYYEFLNDLPGEELLLAARVCANSGTFFPSVHELRRAVGELRTGRAGVPSPYEAWQEVTQRPKDGKGKRLLSENGGWVIETWDIPWSHPLVERVAYQMGWPDFPISDEIGVDRAHFLRAYEQVVERAGRDGLQPPEVVAYLRSGEPDVSREIKALAERLKR